MSLRSDGKSPSMSLKSGSKAATPTPTKRRNSTLWSESLDVHQKSTYSTKEIKRQEVLQFIVVIIIEQCTLIHNGPLMINSVKTW